MRRVNDILSIVLADPGDGIARAGRRLRRSVCPGAARLRAAAGAGLQRRPRHLHPLERILFRWRCQLGSATVRFFHCDAAAGPYQPAASDSRRPSRPSDFQVLGRGSAVQPPGAALFLGYNTQWQDLILGVEATYTHTNLNMTPPSASVGTPLRPAEHTTCVGASGNLNLTDYGTARGRAGYVLGNFLPYGFIGMAVGRASYSVTTAAASYRTSVYRASTPCVTVNLPDVLFLQQRRTKQRSALGLHCRRRVGLGADAEHFRARRIRVRAIRADQQHRGLDGQRPPRRRPQVLNPGFV